MRIIPPCMVTGHGAWQAADQGKRPRVLDVGGLQACLKILGGTVPIVG